MRAAELNEDLDDLESVLASAGAVDPGIARGVKLFVAHLRTSMVGRRSCPYSITSRRYSVWRLVGLYLDEPFTAFVDGQSGTTVGYVLKGYRLSEMHKVEPPRNLGFGCSNSVDYSACRWTYESQRLRLNQWRVLFKEIARWIMWPAFGFDDDDRRRMLRDNLDFMHAELLRFFGKLLPDRQSRSSLRSSLAGMQGTPRFREFCELCWRPTEYASCQQASPDDPAMDSKNKRFCSVHNPSDSESRYRVDHRYKRAFRNELEHQRGWAVSEYSVEFTPTGPTTTAAQRKAAYDLVHARLHSPDADRKRVRSLKEKAYELHGQGLSQSEIARQLGVSRQAVSKALQKMRGILSRREVVKERDAELPEFDPGNILVKLVAELEKQGRTIAVSTSGGDSPARQTRYVTERRFRRLRS
ncbi:MAG: ArsR family transcriptional regulator [Rhodanobacteraceae bacterium]|nr:MAG: ArsR family transcriptional regulator [Rhodanobacteraceae bacterium]